MVRLYVYYAVPEAELAAVSRAAKSMQAELTRAHPGLVCELLRRPGVQPAGVTLMETYMAPDLRHDFTSVLRDAAAALPQPRHVEVFEPLV